MSKQTAVEWLYERLERMIPRSALYNIDKKQYFEQAKKIEKEQIIDAHGVKEYHGAEGSRNLWQQITGKQYYKEQYERDN